MCQGFSHFSGFFPLFSFGQISHQQHKDVLSTCPCWLWPIHLDNLGYAFMRCRAAIDKSVHQIWHNRFVGTDLSTLVLS